MRFKKDFISNKLCKIIISVILIVLISAVLFACDRSDDDSTFVIIFEVDRKVYRTLATTASTSIGLLSSPSKEGFEFGGWFWDKDIWDRPFPHKSLASITLENDITVYAKWQEVKESHYNVVFNSMEEH